MGVVQQLLNGGDFVVRLQPVVGNLSGPFGSDPHLFRRWTVAPDTCVTRRTDPESILA